VFVSLSGASLRNMTNLTIAAPTPVLVDWLRWSLLREQGVLHKIKRHMALIGGSTSSPAWQIQPELAVRPPHALVLPKVALRVSGPLRRRRLIGYMSATRRLLQEYACRCSIAASVRETDQQAQGEGHAHNV
jgi:hypothetical protein